MIDLRNGVNIKGIPESQNPKKVANIIEEILDFNKQQKGKGLPCMLALRHLDLAKPIKTLTPKRMLQRLPIVFAQVKAGDTSRNLLNKIRKIIYFLYWGKDTTKNYTTM